MYLHWFFYSFCFVFGWSDNRQRSFKNGFLFGAASSAYQVEGAWNIDGKGENVWDHYLHEIPNITADGQNGDVAADSYNLYKRDVEILTELGVDFYRFSVSWCRLMPNGLTNEINEKGFQYYDNLIDELLKHNIQPMITLYHFDLPQRLQVLGGWTNPLIIKWFVDYSKVVFDRYAAKVKYWITINQPNFCMEAYGDGVMAPAVKDRGVADYLCVKNVILAHASAYRLYEREYKKKYQGTVGIALSINWGDPYSDEIENVEAAEEFRQFYFGLYIHPIWSKEGGFPPLVKEIVDKRSKAEGYSESRLPKLRPEEVKLLKGSSDFIGMNHYTTVLVRRTDKPGYIGDANIEMSYRPEWEKAKSPWLRKADYGIYKACLYLNKNYDYPRIIITENGWSTDIGIDDYSRVEYLKGYLKALLYAIEDGTELIGYTAWSLLDNFEWIAGMSERFGLYEVDFDSPNKTRTARHSALFYKHVIEKRIVSDDWTPEKKMEISDRSKRKGVKLEL